MEVFKRIKDFDNYEISNLGTVRKITCELMHKTTNGNAIYVYLRKDNKPVGKIVRRLVAEHFVSNPNNYEYVIQKDFDINNLNATNLDWVKDSRTAKMGIPKYNKRPRTKVKDDVWLEDIRGQVKEYDDKLNYFK